MLLKNIQDKTIEELNIKLIDLLREQFNLRLKHSSSKLQQLHLIKLVRRKIARVNTLLTKKEKNRE